MPEKDPKLGIVDYGDNAALSTQLGRCGSITKQAGHNLVLASVNVYALLWTPAQETPVTISLAFSSTLNGIAREAAMNLTATD